MSWTPKFGEPVENTMASIDNPTRVGLFVRVISLPHGVMNAGTWWEFTDGEGLFWQTKPDNCRPPETLRDAIAAALDHPMIEMSHSYLATRKPHEAELALMVPNVERAVLTWFLDHDHASQR